MPFPGLKEDWYSRWTSTQSWSLQRHELHTAHSRRHPATWPLKAACVHVMLALPEVHCLRAQVFTGFPHQLVLLPLLSLVTSQHSLGLHAHRNKKQCAAQMCTFGSNTPLLVKKKTSSWRTSCAHACNPHSVVRPVMHALI